MSVWSQTFCESEIIFWSIRSARTKSQNKIEMLSHTRINNNLIQLTHRISAMANETCGRQTNITIRS